LRATSNDGPVRRDRYLTTQLCDDLEQDDGLALRRFNELPIRTLPAIASMREGPIPPAQLRNPPSSGRVLDLGAAGNGVAAMTRGACELQMNSRKCLERVKGIEPSYEAWEAAVLPLNYTRRSA
jgi:hypothetical protein